MTQASFIGKSPKSLKPDPHGVFWTVLSCVLWGVFPIYWKQLKDLPAEMILVHRILWSALSLHLIIALARWGREWARAIRSPRLFWGLGVSGLLIAFNWYLFVFAVNHGRILETSLGYFLSPILSVLLGAVLFKERLGRHERVAVMLGILAVAIQSVGQLSQTPWIAIGLCTTFAMYGVIRKALHVQSVVATGIETLWMSGAVGIWILVGTQKADAGGMDVVSLNAFVASMMAHPWLLVFSGLVTALPLAAYAEGTRRIPLSLVGLFQYVAPALQFLVAVAVYDEPMNAQRWAGFALVCAAVGVTAAGKLK